MGVVVVQEKIGSAVEQHAPAAEDNRVEFEPVTHTEDNQYERHRVEDIKKILPLREKIPLRPNQLLRMSEDKCFDDEKDKHRQVRYHCAQQHITPQMRLILPI